MPCGIQPDIGQIIFSNYPCALFPATVFPKIVAEAYIHLLSDQVILITLVTDAHVVLLLSLILTLNWHAHYTTGTRSLYTIVFSIALIFYMRKYGM